MCVRKINKNIIPMGIESHDFWNVINDTNLSKDQYHINRIKDRLSSTAAGMSSTANRFLSRLVNIYRTEQSVTMFPAAHSNMFKVTLMSQQQPPLQSPRTWSRNRRPSPSTGSPYYLKRFYYTHSFARTAAAASQRMERDTRLLYPACPAPAQNVADPLCYLTIVSLFVIISVFNVINSSVKRNK